MYNASTVSFAAVTSVEMAATNADSADVTLAWGVAADTEAESVVSVSTPLERIDLAAVVEDLRRSEIDMVELVFVVVGGGIS